MVHASIGLAHDQSRIVVSVPLTNVSAMRSLISSCIHIQANGSEYTALSDSSRALCECERESFNGSENGKGVCSPWIMTIGSWWKFQYSLLVAPLPGWLLFPCSEMHSAELNYCQCMVGVAVTSVPTTHLHPVQTGLFMILWCCAQNIRSGSEIPVALHWLHGAHPLFTRIQQVKWNINVYGVPQYQWSTIGVPARVCHTGDNTSVHI